METYRDRGGLERMKPMMDPVLRAKGVGVRATLALAALMALAGGALAAEPYPDRPITLIVPYAAGGSSDVLARLIGERMSKSLGQQIVVDNRAGAGSRLGIEIAAKSAADGYTLLLADMPHTIIPAIQKGVHYDPVRHFTPIGLIGTASMVFFVNPAVKAETAQDFVALAKAEPEKITIASGGIGSATHLTAELFQAKTGIKLVHVPFRGAGPAMNDLVAGHVQSGFTTLATASSVLDRVRALAVASETRLATPASIPTFKENGIDLVVEHWWGVLAPAGLPPEIAARLTGDLKAILDSQEFATRLAPLGVTASHASPAQFRALIESDTARWAEIVKSVGISVLIREAAMSAFGGNRPCPKSLPCPASRQTHLIRHRRERPSRPPSVSSAAPRAQARASPRPTAKRHRNKPARMLAAGADSPVPARPAAARQLDRRSAAGTLPEPARETKLQPG
jgi:tripartite-type tricarboxylate transporter receptor subunit TctC